MSHRISNHIKQLPGASLGDCHFPVMFSANVTKYRRILGSRMYSPLKHCVSDYTYCGPWCTLDSH